jgi:curved DNA-binding protein CbpA
MHARRVILAKIDCERGKSMRNFYSVLRVAPKASDAEIKTAFRNLAKTCHPDVRPGDSAAEEAFQEAKRAYKFLSNPETRKVYDDYLASRRALERRRFRRAAATMSTSFLLTAATVLGAAFWVEAGGLSFAALSDLVQASARADTVEVVRAPTASGAVTERLPAP